jgi:hypothetical protein
MTLLVHLTVHSKSAMRLYKRSPQLVCERYDQIKLVTHTRDNYAVTAGFWQRWETDWARTKLFELYFKELVDGIAARAEAIAQERKMMRIHDALVSALLCVFAVSTAVVVVVIASSTGSDCAVLICWYTAVSGAAIGVQRVALRARAVY